jgi:hypothetical protein
VTIACGSERVSFGHVAPVSIRLSRLVSILSAKGSDQVLRRFEVASRAMINEGVHPFDRSSGQHQLNGHLDLATGAQHNRKEPLFHSGTLGKLRRIFRLIRHMRKESGGCKSPEGSSESKPCGGDVTRHVGKTRLIPRCSHPHSSTALGISRRNETLRTKLAG